LRIWLLYRFVEDAYAEAGPSKLGWPIANRPQDGILPHKRPNLTLTFAQQRFGRLGAQVADVMEKRNRNRRSLGRGVCLN
jgi:hypothetical protein